MGASSSGLLDEAKVSHIKGLVDCSFQRFSAFYRQQYATAHYGHVHLEVEPKKEGRSLILKQRPQYDPQTVLYQSSVKISCWDEQVKKWRERYVVLRRDYNVEVYENQESFGSRCSPKLIIQPAGGSVFTTEDEFRVHLEKTSSGILNGAREESPSVVSPPEMFAVYLQRPYRGHTCFLFEQQMEQDHFRSHLKTCIRHHNLDPWRNSSVESQAFLRALRLYRQDKGCYEFWEMHLGTEQQVLANEVMKEVLPWLLTQVQSRVKGKRMERIRLWQATVQTTYATVLEQLTTKLESLINECCQTASANQMLIISNLDQILTSRCSLEQKVKDCISKDAEEVCSGSITPYMSSMTEALTENISAAFVGMQDALHAQMDSVFSETVGGAEKTNQASYSLSSIILDLYYQQVEKVADKLEDLKQHFGSIDLQRLIFSTHVEMEQLLDNALYTLEQFIKSSAGLQPSQVPVKLERAKERVLKQLDYDSRLVLRRIYQEALLEITLPFLTKAMDRRWRSDLQQFEQYIFSDYSSFILVQNIYEDVLRNILSTEIEKVLQEAASRKTNNLLLDMSDLALSQYSLLGPTPPHSAPGSPAVHPRLSSSVVPIKDEELPPLELSNGDKVTRPNQSSEQSKVIVTPVILVTQDQSSEETSEIVVVKAVKTETETLTSEEVVKDDVNTADQPTDPQSTILNSPDQQSIETGSDHSSTTDLSSSDQRPENIPSIEPSSSLDIDQPLKINLGTLSEAISGNSGETPAAMVQKMTDRAVYLKGEIKKNWEAEKEKQKNEAGDKKEGILKAEEDDPFKDSCPSSGLPAEGAITDQEDGKGQLRNEDKEATNQGRHTEEEKENVKEGSQPIESRPESVIELPLDSIALIRELVTEVTVVETTISPCDIHSSLTETSAAQPDVHP